MMGDKKKAMTAMLGPDPAEHEAKPADADHELRTIAEEMIHCLHSSDAEGVAHCLKAAFMLCDSEPHDEGEHGG